MAAGVKSSPGQQSLDIGTPQALFAPPIAGGGLNGLFKQNYSVSPDGQRFLINITTEESAASPINIIYNWKPKSAK
jgi:hypothetical protein